MSVEQEEQILSRLNHIDDQLAQLRTAITGDRSLGHKGLVERLEVVETMHAEVPAVHQGIEQRARQARTEIWGEIDRLKRNWFFVAGLVIGSGIVGGGIGAVLANNVPFFGG